MPRSLQILLLLLAPIAVFGAMIGADRIFGGPGRGRDYIIRMNLPPAGGEIGLPEVLGPPDASRPLVVIDAGHGGHDPGAGSGSLKEKALTLSLAQALRDRLLEMGGIRVALTRDDDSYLFLPERSGIGRRLKADLFISIHADSTEGSIASGATVYTLSERGTNEVAQKLAVQENRADEVNGINLGDTSDAVSAILIDLSQRETQAKSEEFARLLLREGQGRIGFRENTVQSAAFAVLKSPDLPSVLFESGYINNDEDAARLASPAGRAQFSDIAARAIRVYFARQSGVRQTGG
jgi:N-acetylmuramoyl-L-alanine amidase